MLLLAFSAEAQVKGSVQLRKLNPGTSTEKILCFALELSLTDEQQVYLASQNYRLFYNAAELGFLPDQTGIKLPDENYDIRIVQNLSGIDASGVGKLKFENNLGFINATVVLMGSLNSALVMDQPGEWINVTDFCFEKLSENAEAHIIFARADKTSAYGRAYSEISVLGAGEEMLSLQIARFGDID